MPMMKRSLLVACVLVLACGEKSTESAPSKTKDSASSKKTLNKLSAAWFGKTPAAPPTGFGKLVPGMPEADAKKREPDIMKYGGDSGVENVSLGTKVWLNEIELVVVMPADATRLVHDAWGEGQHVEIIKGTTVSVWFDTKANIRATLDDVPRGGRAALRFTRFVPVAKLLGTGPDLPLLAKGVIGKSRAELRKLYPAWVDQNDDLYLPSTEWDLMGPILVVTLPLDTSKPVEGFELSIPFKTPASGDEIVKLAKAKWPAGEMNVTRQKDSVRIATRKLP